MISDVPGDDPAMIGSGPTVGEAGTAAQARDLVMRYGIDLPASAKAVLEGESGVIPPGDPRLSRVENIVFAAPSQSLDAAAEVARSEGIRVEMLGSDLEGEAREVASAHTALARETQARLSPGTAPVLLLSGGELTVTRRGDGVGGPNAEYALALALHLKEAADVHAISCDTDGVDGAAEVAGATIAPDTLPRARAAGFDPEAALARNDAHGFFAAIGDQVITGPTLTNVNDFRAILVAPA